MAYIIGKPGPFQIIRSTDSGSNDAPSAPPRRRCNCSNYMGCLSIAAALDWDSFTCRDCSGEVDETLLWRAHQAIRKDVISKRICTLPTIPTFGKDEDLIPQPMVLVRR